MSGTSVKYKRGGILRLPSLPIEDGSLIFTTDSNEIFLDVGSTRINLSGTTMVGASKYENGKSGVVPAPNAGNNNDFLRGDGTWTSPTFSAEYLESIIQTVTDEACKKCMNTLLSSMYPIGCIYTSTEPTDPSTLIGGTWVRIKDTFLLAAGDEYAAGETGGESRHELTISELPNHAHNATTNTVDAHSHSIGGISGAFSLGLGTDMNVSTNTGSSSYTETPTTSAGDHSHTVTVESTGGNNAHNNMPPYLVVYVWQRVS